MQEIKGRDQVFEYVDTPPPKDVVDVEFEEIKDTINYHENLPSKLIVLTFGVLVVMAIWKILVGIICIWLLCEILKLLKRNNPKNRMERLDYNLPTIDELHSGQTNHTTNNIQVKQKAHTIINYFN